MGYSKSSYKIRRIDPETFAIIDRFAGMSAFCYLCIGAERAALIDTGMGCGDLPAVLRGLTGRPVTVLCTHGHIDHCGGNHHFDSVSMSLLDLPVARLHFNRSYAEPAMTAAIPRYPRFLTALPFKRLFSNAHNESYEDIEDGQTLDLGGRVIEALAAPGHSVGSMCFLDGGRGYLFGGDAIGERDVLLNMCGSTDAKTYLKTLLNLKSRSDRWDKIYAGHHWRFFPLDNSYIERYIACAGKIISKKAVFRQNRTGYSVFEGDINIKLPRSPGTRLIPAPGELPYMGDYKR